MTKKTKTPEINFLDEKYKYTKGLPWYIYTNGFCIFRDEQYWGHATPLEIQYTLVDENGDEVSGSYKGMIKEDIREWDEKYGKRKRVK